MMGRPLEGAIDFIKRVSGKKLTENEIEEMKALMLETWLHGDHVH